MTTEHDEIEEFVLELFKDPEFEAAAEKAIADVEKKHPGHIKLLLETCPEV